MSVALGASMVMPVMAADTSTVTITTDDLSGEETVGTSKSIEITAGYDKADVTADQVTANYYVVLKWTPDSTLAYKIDKTSYTWNVYDSANVKSTEDTFNGTAAKAGYEAKGNWSGEATVNVVVENWSNRTVKASYAYADEPGITSTNNIAELSEQSIGAASDGVTVANGETIDTAKKVTADFKISAITAGEISSNNEKIGTLTVTLKK